MESREDQILATLKTEYQNVRVLEDGTIVGTSKLLFTTALYIGLNEWGWERRYCYQDLDALYESLKALRTVDDEPHGYIAKRGS